MGHTKGIVTLKSIVMNVLNDIGEAGNMDQYMRFLQFATRGVKDLSLFHLNIVQTARIDMTDINTIILPMDFVSFIAIGVPYRGRLWTFTQDKYMVIPLTEDCGEDALDNDYGEGYDINTGYTVTGYGVPGGGNVYYFKLDLAHNRIVLSGFDRTTVTLKYVSTGVNFTDETIIPRMAEEAVIAWVHVLRTRNDRKISQVNKKDAEIVLYNETEKLRDLQAPSLDVMYDAIYETFYQTAKR